MGKNSEKLSEFLERRTRLERRQRAVKSIICSMYKGRRRQPQRTAEISQPYYTDNYEAALLALILSIVSLCAADAGLTLLILVGDGIELNPVMVWLLEFGAPTFFAMKFLTTAICLIFLVIHINFRLFRTVSMHQLLYGILGIYIFLIGYEIFLLAFIDEVIKN